MTFHVPDPAERDVLRAEDELLAGLVGDYVQRREAGRPPAVRDLLARASEFGLETGVMWLPGTRGFHVLRDATVVLKRRAIELNVSPCCTS